MKTNKKQERGKVKIFTKEWWSRFDKEERQYINYFFRNKGKVFLGYNLPPDAIECAICSRLAHTSPCMDCSKTFDNLIESKGLKAPDY